MGALTGRRIVVPETREIEVLAGMLERHGAAVIRCPLVAIRDAADPTPVVAWLERFVTEPPDDLILFTGEGLQRLNKLAGLHGLSEKFVATLQRWAKAYTYSDTSPVPSMSSEDWARLNGIPTLIFRSGQSDLHHTRRTSEWVHELLPSSKFIEPPWGDREWIDRVAAWRDGKGTLFQNWPKLAPTILEFTARRAAT